MDIAFKEWAVVCDALATGRQVVILRKGGTDEDEGQFRPDHDEFLLFPTYLHEASDRVIPAARAHLARLNAARPDANTVALSHFAAVTEAMEVKALDALNALRGNHIWTDAEVEERFRRWREDRVYALVVRVWALSLPVLLPMKPAYSGCKSWVRLDADVSTEGAKPVLHDPDFDSRSCAVRIALGRL